MAVRISLTLAMKSVGSGPLLSVAAASGSEKTGSPTFTRGRPSAMAESTVVLELSQPSNSVRPAIQVSAHRRSVLRVVALAPSGGFVVGDSVPKSSVPFSQSR
jgi:hypothetical protein